MDETISTLRIEIGASSDAAVQQVEKTTSALQSLRKETNQRFNNPLKDIGGSSFDAAKMSAKLHSVDAQIAKTTRAIEQLQKAMATPGDGQMGPPVYNKEIAAQISEYQNLLQSLGEQKAELQEKIRLRVDANDVDSAHKKVSKLATAWNALKRIAFYRVIRAAIKSVTQAFSEGLEAAYLFSAGIDGEGNRFAAAMDRIKSSGNEMKGQLGSAFISLIATIEPIIIQLVNLITRAADALAQLFAAFTGRTYLKANATAAQFADTMARGGAAAKAWKNQLMGFDVINRLEEPSKGGGGGGVDPLAGYAFEETDISEFWLGVAERLRPIVDGIKLIFEGLSDFILGVFTGDWQKMCQGLVKMLEGASKILDGIVVGIETLLLSFISFVQNGVTDLLSWVEEKTGIDLGAVKESWNTFCEDTKSIVSDMCKEIRGYLSDVTGFLSSVFTGDWESAWESVKNIFSRIFHEILNIGIGIINNIIGAINTGLSWINSVAGWLGSNINLHISTLPRFATGGFPEDGIFAANHGELVGQFSNGKTAVANNEQITEGIAKAVYEAFVEAFTQTNGGGGNDQPVNLYLDGKLIAESTTRYQRQFARANG